MRMTAEEQRRIESTEYSSNLLDMSVSNASMVMYIAVDADPRLSFIVIRLCTSIEPTSLSNRIVS